MVAMAQWRPKGVLAFTLGHLFSISIHCNSTCNNNRKEKGKGRGQTREQLLFFLYCAVPHFAKVAMFIAFDLAARDTT
jgi:hypothetical protein